MEYLKKLFIKDYKNTKNNEVRFKYGLVAGIIGIISNVILFAFKILVGIIGHSITIIADAVNNLSDAGGSIVTLVGFKIAAKPADEDHPYGHARFEYIAAIFISFLILAVGLKLAQSSIEKIMTPTETIVSLVTYIVLFGSILLKLFQFLMYKDFAKAIDSNSLKASSQDSLNDILATGLVLVSTIIIDATNITSVSIDGIFGLIVSIYIIISVLKLLKETIDPILGQKADKELVNEIENKILSYDGILGVHDLMLHNYGAGKNILMAHVEVDANKPFLESHDLIDIIENDIKSTMGIITSLHMDPIVTDNEEVNRLKEITKNALEEINPEFKFHDFRVVFGKTHNNILFDVVVPFSDKITLTELKEKLSTYYIDEKIKTFLIIQIDREC